MDDNDQPAPPLPSTRTPGATRKGVETRARIIRGALEALESGGMETLTTRKIAASAGVKLATLHYYFDSKENLLLAVLEDLIADMAEAYRQDMSMPSDPEERIEALIRSMWRYVQRTRNKQLAQTELTLYALRTQGAEWLAARQYNAYIDFYCRLVFHGMGELTEEQRKIGTAIARFMLIGIDGLILQNFALHNNGDTNEGVETLVIATRDLLHRLRSEAGIQPG
ncbi:MULTISPECIES: TetR/AcrR family transcriptional regulator [Alphaproteobacteria]|uniref:Transcriptional regulator, TetR family protein n=2 Tax=Alphaproteobacteria TaxID=28211 RepID=A0ABQ6E938_9SPHN|nr:MULTISPECIES: TetR/AcrR family transcriptional regulator [Alphaproteobacteria]GEO85503.1 putative transcriptional regulator, TetR family protein [Ciceribacter naphthalenivorans]GLR21475.1 putative transcriptional regulator, TetR family protein [Ciceribacter naphthalenivorans]GLT04331.1 putative transcriptional regulator, TetR family protein [Sphingomonas psychrolutea]